MNVLKSILWSCSRMKLTNSSPLRPTTNLKSQKSLVFTDKWYVMSSLRSRPKHVYISHPGNPRHCCSAHSRTTTRTLPHRKPFFISHQARRHQQAGSRSALGAKRYSLESLGSSYRTYICAFLSKHKHMLIIAASYKTKPISTIIPNQPISAMSSGYEVPVLSQTL